jgi:GT2 family glycosyltransferase
VTRALTLVVCTLDRPAAVRALLVALAAQTHPAGEVLVVDASADGDTAEVVADVAPGWPGHLRHVAVTGDQRGLTRQRNVGIEVATGDLVAFLDDDTVPAPSYLREVHACFERHPDAVGVGGAIDEGGWVRHQGAPPRPGWYRSGAWERPEGLRWRLRRRLGLAGDRPAGWIPPGGHGRPVAFLPPDGEDHEVELVMGGASAWRRRVFDQHRFDPGFAGYGLYEDLDLCLTVGADGPLYLATAARLEHHHAPESRPDHDRYGRMVVTNGWYVWRRRWPRPRRVDRVRWWATTFVLAACRAAGGRAGRQEAWGRLQAMAATLPCEWSSRAVRRRYAAHDHVELLASAGRTGA